HRRRLRTINVLERRNEGLKRRTRVAGLFPNEATALRLVSAVAMEISEEWETSRKYLTMGPSWPADAQAANLQKRGALPAQVQRGPFDRFPEGQECRAAPPGTAP